MAGIRDAYDRRVDLADWVIAELDETVGRLRDQVIALIPLERRLERMPGGNSVTWATYHVARHAVLALQVAGAHAFGPDPRLADFEPAATAGGAGLQEVQQPWTDGLDPLAVDAYALSVFADVRRYLETFDPADDSVPDVEAALVKAGVDLDQFGWLLRMWSQPSGFLVRWPMIGHVTNHVGEMIATRNQMGLSPFR